MGGRMGGCSVWRRGRDLNPRGRPPTGLAGRRHTRLGDRGFRVKMISLTSSLFIIIVAIG